MAKAHRCSYNQLGTAERSWRFVEEYMMDDRTNSTQPEAGSEIAVVDERTIRDKIYIVLGVKVMLGL